MEGGHVRGLLSGGQVDPLVGCGRIDFRVEYLGALPRRHDGRGIQPRVCGSHFEITAIAGLLLLWTELGGHEPRAIRRALWIGVSLGVFALLGSATAFRVVVPPVAGLIAAGWTWSLFLVLAQAAVQRSSERVTIAALLGQDRTWAGLLAATAVYLMYHYF